jgi:uncharacterized membrane protein YhiD involved in acid resistance
LGGLLSFVSVANDPFSSLIGFLTLWGVSIAIIASGDQESKLSFLQTVAAANHFNMLGSGIALFAFSNCAAMAIATCVVAWFSLAIVFQLLETSVLDKKVAERREKEEEKEAEVEEKEREAEKKEREKEERRFRYKEIQEKLRSREREIERLERKTQRRYRSGDPKPPEPGEEDEGIPYFRNMPM